MTYFCSDFAVLPTLMTLQTSEMLAGMSGLPAIGLLSQPSTASPNMLVQLYESEHAKCASSFEGCNTNPRYCNPVLEPGPTVAFPHNSPLHCHSAMHAGPQARPLMKFAPTSASTRRLLRLPSYAARSMATSLLTSVPAHHTT
jgi:hypothetical protein